MKQSLTAAVLLAVPYWVGAQESYIQYIEDFSSASKIVNQFQTERISDIAVNAGFYGANLGVISPFLINRLDLAVGFTKLNFDIPAPFFVEQPVSVTFTVGGNLNFERNGNPAGYSPQPFSFNVRATCSYGYCRNYEDGGPPLGGVQLSTSRQGTAPFFPYDFSVNINTLSVGGVNYYTQNLPIISLGVSYQYSAVLQNRTMSDFTKAVGWSFEQAGRTELARGAAMEELLSSAGAVNSLAGLSKHVVGGKISDQGMSEFSSAMDVANGLSTVGQNLKNLVNPIPTKPTQEYATDILEKSMALGGDSLAAAMNGGKASALDLARAVNLTAMSVNLGAANVGAWISNDPPDFNYKDFDDFSLAQIEAIERIGILLDQAEEIGALGHNLIPLRNLLGIGSFQAVVLASAGVAYERYNGAFLSQALDYAESQYSGYRGGAEQMPDLSAQYSQKWALADQALSQIKIPTLTQADIDAARDVVLAAIDYTRTKRSTSRDAGEFPTIEALTALLEQINGLKLLDLQGLTMADLMVPNYGQIALDRYAVTSVPEPSAWAMFLAGAVATTLWWRRNRRSLKSRATY